MDQVRAYLTSQLLGNLAALLVMPILVVGVIQRVKARWAGRKGPPLMQLGYDLWRLARKRSVLSTTTTAVFQLAPYVVLVTALGSACLVPLAGGPALASFRFDFVWFAYVWGLGRVALILGALDTGSAFEGMGASREATFSAILEPALFLAAGALSLASGERELSLLLVPQVAGGAALVVWAGALVALVIVVQVEAARMPIDDPTTHLELTMIHEVMVLDHSGRELAAVQWASAIKLYVGLSVLATLMHPRTPGLPGVALHLGLCLALAAALGLSESLIARLKLRTIPQYLVVALSAGAVALLAALAMAGRLGILR
ncbi:MAG: NADH-quinone oxidoreductase subunit H [Myxococcales bacterium]|nr:NADH-quinone oxidoreductase subunit H [Myxococcales bacterium]